MDSGAIVGAAEQIGVKTDLNKLPKYYPALDGLRGLAILLVLLFHFTIRANTIEGSFTALERFFALGWCGVDLFFVLSGFLITGILVDAKQRSGYFKNFYGRRFLRIFPLYYLFLIGMLFLVPLMTGSIDPALESNKLAQLSLWFHFSNLYQAQLETWLPSGFSHLWSLAIEEQFYLIWPLVVYLLSKRKLLWVSAFCVLGVWLTRFVLVEVGFSKIAVYTLPVTRLDALASGAFVAMLLRQYSVRSSWTFIANGVVLCSLLGLASVFAWQGNVNPLSPLSQQYSYALFTALFSALVFLAIRPDSKSYFQKVLSNRFLALLGRYSYFIYIVHHPFFGLMENYQVFLITKVPLIDFSICVALLMVLASVSWYLFEKPILRLKRHFDYDQPARPKAKPIKPESSVNPAPLFPIRGWDRI